MRGQRDLAGLLLQGDAREVVGRRRQGDGAAADEHQEDDDDEAQEADAAVHAAAAADAAAAGHGAREVTQAAAAPAGRATPSCGAGRHQRSAPPFAPALARGAFRGPPMVRVDQAEFVLGHPPDVHGRGELREVLGKTRVVGAHLTRLPGDGVRLQGLLHHGEAQGHAAHGERREDDDEDHDDAIDAGAGRRPAPRLRRPARRRQRVALVVGARLDRRPPRLCRRGHRPS